METILLALLWLGGLGVALAWVLLLAAGLRRRVLSALGILPLVALGAGALVLSAWARANQLGPHWLGYVATWNVAAIVLSFVAVRAARTAGRPSVRARWILGFGSLVVFVSSYLGLDALRSRELERRADRAGEELDRTAPAALAAADDALTDWQEAERLLAAWEQGRRGDDDDEFFEDSEDSEDSQRVEWPAWMEDSLVAVSDHRDEVDVLLEELAPVLAAADRALSKPGYRVALHRSHVEATRDDRSRYFPSTLAALFEVDALRLVAAGDAAGFERAARRLRSLARQLARPPEILFALLALRADERVVRVYQDALALAPAGVALALPPSLIGADAVDLVSLVVSREHELLERTLAEVLVEGEGLEGPPGMDAPGARFVTTLWRSFYRVFAVPAELTVVDRSRDRVSRAAAGRSDGRALESEEECVAPMASPLLMGLDFSSRAAPGHATIDALGAVAAAVVRYRRREGAYPESLEALVPRDLASVPVDAYPASGRPLGYERVDGGAVVWSRCVQTRDDRDWRVLLPEDGRRWGGDATHVFLLGDLWHEHRRAGPRDDDAPR